MSDIPNVLRDWLIEHHATPLREEQVGGDLLTWYSINERVILVQVYANEDGVEVFLPTPSKWDDCLQAVANNCEV